jgi:HSP20 family protein
MLAYNLTRDPFASLTTDLTTSLWREMSRLQDEMNRFLSRFYRWQPDTASFPAINIWTNDQQAVVTTELPGIDLNDLDISVAGNTLTIRGTRKAEQVQNVVTYHRQERGYGNFSRVVQLPFNVEPDQVNATMKNGVLIITLPRAYAERPRKIEIKAA